MAFASIIIMLIAMIICIAGLFVEGLDLTTIGLIVLVIGWMVYAYEAEHK